MARLKGRLNYVRYKAECLERDCEWSHYSLHHMFPIRNSTTPNLAQDHARATGHLVEVTRSVRLKYLRPRRDPTTGNDLSLEQRVLSTNV